MVVAANNSTDQSRIEHETKFVFDNGKAPILIEWLRRRCTPDPDYPEGVVSSIYFDTPDWKFLNEKINSDFLKTKVRLRWYADIDYNVVNDAVFLEVKYKVGGARRKFRKRIDLAPQRLAGGGLSSPELRQLPFMLMREGVIVPGRLLPAFKITYKRFRFIEPVTSARLSIDYDIAAPAVNHQMIGRSNPFALRDAVFELKGPIRNLPHVLHQLTAMGCRKDSFSKYSVCFQKITGITF